ncbi:predicted protein [Sclerotinia sclerotiorum 1980 UF-70]|uniref:Uncharacterized protein n=1 Tax=Sclerotinia sclerotiorum (strain ATCC 18683 / 1980 / Ss-1) TaxID=665079 RepID=A7E8U6_SCLS1|nr:predicted protein [Sclerotinia sclerotiorum 1980 UF-70]EDN96798.1 predicted protein [Sclerotinia sclerotiorum 1980 UF-70]
MTRNNALAMLSQESQVAVTELVPKPARQPSTWYAWMCWQAIWYSSEACGVLGSKVGHPT